MKLNTDCIRAVLLELERQLEYTVNDENAIERNHVTLETLDGLLIPYSKEEIFYSIKNLEQAGYIETLTRWSGNCVYLCVVYELTFNGHEFLNKIRDDHSWGKIKGVVASVRDYSLDAINSIANGIASAAISAYFQKTK